MKFVYIYDAANCPCLSTSTAIAPLNCKLFDMRIFGVGNRYWSRFSIFICSVIVLHWSFSGFDTIRLEILLSNKFSSKHAPYLCSTILVYLNVLLVICWILLGRSEQLPDMAIVLGTLDWSAQFAVSQLFLKEKQYWFLFPRWQWCQ